MAFDQHADTGSLHLINMAIGHGRLNQHRRSSNVQFSLLALARMIDFGIGGKEVF